MAKQMPKTAATIQRPTDPTDMPPKASLAAAAATVATTKVTAATIPVPTAFRDFATDAMSAAAANPASAIQNIRTSPLCLARISAAPNGASAKSIERSPNVGSYSFSYTWVVVYAMPVASVPFATTVSVFLSGDSVHVAVSLPTSSPSSVRSIVFASTRFSTTLALP